MTNKCKVFLTGHPADGYKERNRGGRYLRDETGDKVLYDNKNNLLDKTDVVWVVQHGPESTIKYCPWVDSIWYDYNLAFDQAEKVGGWLEKWIVKRK